MKYVAVPPLWQENTLQKQRGIFEGLIISIIDLSADYFIN